MEGYNLTIRIELDLSLARGLDYYTGCIFEAIVPDSGIGSISGGGRYDDLTGVFGLIDVSGVGISFGIDRIYEILESQGLWPETQASSDLILFCHFDETSMQHCIKLSHFFRDAGINTIVYPDLKRINKQFDYANKSGIKYAVVIGDNEIANKTVSLKNLVAGTQDSMSIEEAIHKVS